MKGEKRSTIRTALVICFLFSASLFVVYRGNMRVSASPTTWTVDDDRPADFNTIGQAISASKDGDTILVFSGTYRESLSIGKSLTLKGENAETTVIQGSGAFAVVHITGNNVVLAGFTVKEGTIGVFVDEARTNKVVDNIITGNSDGLREWYSVNDRIINNTIAWNTVGVYLYSSNSTTLEGNTVGNNDYGVDTEYCTSATLAENFVTLSSVEGIFAFYYNNGTVSQNTIRNNAVGMHLDSSCGNYIYQNNLIDNQNQTCVESANNQWDNGQEGNFWSDYVGGDANNNGIGDTPYTINENNKDRYPLVRPWTNIAVSNTKPSKTVVEQGATLNISLVAENQGWNAEMTNITAHVDTTIMAVYTNVIIDGRQGLVITFVWNTSSLDKGNYTIGAGAEPVQGETNKMDNTCDFLVVVTIEADINGDFAVDIYDAITLAGAYGSVPTSSLWNPNTDINDDATVDVYDAIILAGNYGKKTDF